MYRIKIKKLKSNVTSLKASFILSSNCVSDPDKLPINIEGAKGIINSLLTNSGVFLWCNEDPVTHSVPSLVSSSFEYELEPSEYVPTNTSAPVIETPKIEMKVSQPKVKGPVMNTEVSLADGIFERAMRSVLQSEVNNVIKGLLPEIQKIINHELTTNFVKRVEIKVNDSKWVDVGHQHYRFPELLRVCMSRLPSGESVNTWLVGPAGTGKTTACLNVAKAMNARTFGAIGTSDNKYELSGFTDAQGKIVNTIFRDIFTNGGVMLLDEIDSWYPNALLALQAALSNGFCAFPDGVFERHADCIIICAANTYGQGEVTEYVGRMKQDAAFLDRFVFFKWDIDEQLERHIAGNAEWVTRVQALRKRAAERGVKVLITPRASLLGAALLNSGVPWKDVEAMTVRKSMTSEQWKSIQ